MFKSNKILKSAILFSGWLVFVFSLILSNQYQKLTTEDYSFSIKNLNWKNQKSLIKGAFQCNLLDEELEARKLILKEKIFSRVSKKEKVNDGYIFYFHYDKDLLGEVIEHLLIEKECCPFFRFDLTILPFDQGFAFQISGTEEAFELMEEFLNGEVLF